MEENREYYNEKRRNCFIHTPTKKKKNRKKEKKHLKLKSRPWTQLIKKMCNLFFIDLRVCMLPAYYMNVIGMMADVRRNLPVTLATDSHIRNLRTRFDRCVR